MTGEILNAKITSTMLGYEDHGILTCWLQFEHQSGSQGFGGYAFDKPVKDSQGKFVCRIPTDFGMRFVAEILRVVGVDSWEKLSGKFCRIEASHSKIFSIGNLLKDDWFRPDDLIAKCGLA